MALCDLSARLFLPSTTQWFGWGTLTQLGEKIEPQGKEDLTPWAQSISGRVVYTQRIAVSQGVQDTFKNHNVFLSAREKPVENGDVMFEVCTHVYWPV